MMNARMAPLINIRGWIEGTQDDLEAAQQSIRADVTNSWLNFGWRFPNHQMTGHWYAFFGLHTYEKDVDWFLDRLRHLATLATSGGKSSIRGLFVISDEQKTMSQVRVRDEQVHVMPGDPSHAYLDG